MESLSDATCEWFFIKLKEVIGDNEELTVISNMDTSISKALEKSIQQLLMEYVVCTNNLLNNMHLKFGDIGKDQFISFSNMHKSSAKQSWLFFAAWKLLKFNTLAKAIYGQNHKVLH